MTEVKELIKQRGITKAKLTRFKNYFNQKASPDELGQLKLRLEIFQKLYTEFDNVQIQIDSINNSEDVDERDKFETDYFELVDSVHKFIEEHSPKSQPVSIKHDCTINNQDPGSLNSMKLPTINLPTFHGNYDEWSSFSDIFKSVIENNTTLTETQKFYYLKSALKGDAAAILHSLEGSAGNYQIAWQLLQARYENKRYLINKHVKALFSQNKIEKVSAKPIRQIIDDTQKHLRALAGLGQPTSQWDTLIIHIITRQLDTCTFSEWETSLKSGEVPTLKELLQFLEQKCQILEAVEDRQFSFKRPVHTFNVQHHKNKALPKANPTVSYSMSVNKCLVCEKGHAIYSCDKFLALSISDREKEVKRLKLCFNCLSEKHKSSECTSGTCKLCNKKHNSLLHFPDSHNRAGAIQPKAQTSADVPTTVNSRVNDVPQKVLSHLNSNEINCSILLSTAVVTILDSHGTPHLCRALLDSGSQSNFCSERLVKSLHLITKRKCLEISGIGQASTQTTQCTQCIIRSRVNTFSTAVDCIVLKTITQQLPTVSIAKSSVNVPQNLPLADPGFNKPSEIDLLIGAEHFFELLCDGKIKPPGTSVVLQNTELGWIVSGKVASAGATGVALSCNLSVEEKLSDQLQNFWKVEEVNHSAKNQLSAKELECENHFTDTVTRDDTGRFVVRLPLKIGGELGASKETAMKRLLAQERRFNKDARLKERYCAFMKEYAELGHMELVSEETDVQNQPVYYLPHHAVTNEASSTTKLRVVFDGSCKTSTGISLNDILMVGPKIQEDLFQILLRFRKHQFVFTADIEKMYRQIMVQEKDRDLQRILWRENPNQPVKTFRLTTVTYGTASAPFLATRCLHEVAVQEQNRFPKAAERTKSDFYVDDILSGADTIQEAKILQSDLISMLKSGGFQLRKWCANDLRLLECLPESHIHQKYSVHSTNEEECVKMLGVQWNPKEDTFLFLVKQKPDQDLTQRRVLSQIASLFDPLGIIGPVILKAKIFMQQLWLLKIGWDDPLPDQFQESWKTFVNELPELQLLSVPRRLSPSVTQNVELHGFCDASEVAYGACIYTRSETPDAKVHIRLVCSKSRVAPIKKVSLPRLELCAALLLSQLVNQVITSLKNDYSKVVLWSDSTVTLCWINSSSHQWKTFVANRVAEIHELTGAYEWNYVRGKENPADFISRGVMPSEIQDTKMWWSGPDWLTGEKNSWPVRESKETDLERKKLAVVAAVAGTVELWEKYSSFSKLQRVMAYCIRFVNNCKSEKIKRSVGILSSEEMSGALICLVKQAQKETFVKELNNLQKEQSVHSTSQLKTLHPFLDKDGIIRVGGRISNSKVNFNQKHPILLPAKHRLTTLIVEYEHVRQLHAGPQLLLSSVRTKFWPLNGKNVVKKVVHQCIPCFKVKPKNFTQLMGDLPKERVQPTRPFLNTGVDYCGPVLIRPSKRKGVASIKTYIAVFVCFSTKAIHLELVSSLTTEAFLGALKRFMARRGKVSQLFSDNATNFVGARNELNFLANLMQSKEHQEELEQWLMQDNIKWSFIPPRSPHFGGLWEAGVKSVKHHLKRVAGSALFTYEEMYTLLTSIEACLNSRPITPLSNDPNDLFPLTPGHFLVGDVITAAVEPDLQDVPTNRLTRWQLVQQQFQSFWARWSVEYLSNFQQRVKWQGRCKQPCVGDLMIIKEDNLPPMKWKLGRIVALHPGRDGVSRVVTLKTSSGVIKRALTRLCPLPIEE